MENQQEPLIQLPLDQLENTLPSTINDVHPSQTHNQNSNDEGKARRTRSKWTQEETEDLIRGCATHGVGNWKKYVLLSYRV
jgi:Myb-like DNA-binding domain